MKKTKSIKRTEDQAIKEYLRKTMDEAEKESRAPLPWQHGLWKQLDRIEKMLKWLVLIKKSNMTDLESNLAWMGDRWVKLPDLSDIKMGEVVQVQEKPKK